MISMAARCSEVCGWGQDSLPAMEKKVSFNSKYVLIPEYKQPKNHLKLHRVKFTRRCIKIHWNALFLRCKKSKKICGKSQCDKVNLTNQEKSSIHNSSSVQHRCHKNVVARTINKRDMSTNHKHIIKNYYREACLYSTRGVSSSK